MAHMEHEVAVHHTHMQLNSSFTLSVLSEMESIDRLLLFPTPTLKLYGKI